MIRLLHLADLHLGRPFRMLGERGAAQRRALEAALVRTVDLAVAEGVHLVLIAGDLFDSPHPSPATLDLVGRELRRLEEAQIRIAVVAGNHDVGRDGYLGGHDRLRTACPSTIFFGPTVETVTFADLDLTVIGRSPDPGAATSPLAGWPRGRTTRFAVGLTHGSLYRAGVVEGPGVIHPQEIRDLGLDYLALGDWHSAAEVVGPPTPAWYAGSPELLAYDQEGAGHVLLVEIAAPGAAQIRRQRVGRRVYRRIDLDVAAADDSAIRRAIEAAADAETICDVTLTGLVPLDRILNTRALEEELADRFFRLRITNRTQVWVDERSLHAVSPDTVLGRYVRLMQDKIAAASEEERPLLEEALQMGVAVLQGREVLA
ncbi:MAG: DNA repair exonuclease [Armatimonadota bacterium]|nr:DNA repair exonuclease [Armatimonadota bacterium]MDR7450251.1 DNA repair exonuclease [Armatimonadota bacterium]MDR7467166.1 DNA repair exonuclease [Armatimonadota bacterium]MDR7493292.1 DNA repair exonuclease [Armatimonadota bacterium]MDR7500141.1 DNA repair exonuclease [Armatimonadota bacterium]